jgi:rhamnose utilization protein RhaD (predicted bifunctional aldolase and dehydrogenase)
MVWMQHGLVTWGETARESYERTIELVDAAERYLEEKAKRRLTVEVTTPLETAAARLEQVAPIVRGLLAEAARRFKVQQTGGDVVMVSTKNVFAPGAGFECA